MSAPMPSDPIRLADELDRFKREIDLGEYAAAHGYVLDRRESSRGSAVMRHPDGDKIVVARGQDGHWIYFSVRSDRDRGSIVDFVQRRRRYSLGEIRRELRPWIGGAVARPAPELYTRDLVPVSRDRTAVLHALAGMRPLERHRYLESVRAIPAALFAEPRFAGRVLLDRRGNAVFPHRDRIGPCGYEIKNGGFTGFAPHGRKGLWVSAARRGDTALVFAESALDVISYAVLHPDAAARYASFAGAWNPEQPALIRAAIVRLPPGGRVVLATDCDPEGDRFAQAIAALAADTGRADIVVERAVPPAPKDWNDVLRRARCP